VAENSVFVRPNDIGMLPDDDWHYITFLSSSTIGYFWSEQSNLKEVKLHSSQTFEENQILTLKLIKYEIDNKFLDDIANSLIDIIERTIVIDKKRIQFFRTLIKERGTAREKAGFISYLTRTNLDAEFLIVSRKD